MWKIEFDAKALRDLDSIYDHLVRSYVGFGETVREAFAHADRRFARLDRTLAGLMAAPFRGERHDDIVTGLRHLTRDRFILLFKVDEDAEVIRILGVFFGGEDHQRQMLARLIADH
jgi:plasmid stabilization system protein ParE